MKIKIKDNSQLVNECIVTVRFSEVDSLKIVWHGHYIKYFEDGRESFGKQYGIGYLDLFRQGLLTPIVEVNCNYKRHLSYGDKVFIETSFVNDEAAKIIYNFKLYRESDRELVATGNSVQVFLNEEGELLLTNPEKFIEWKKINGLLEE
ncbi:MAG: acyl-CoA thioesterase [Bacteroidales bacterium]|nr:acyl-CoA thioesterase [Bacteroidales bacterium]